MIVVTVLLAAVIVAGVVWLGHLDLGLPPSGWIGAPRHVTGPQITAVACQSVADSMRLMVQEQIMRDRPQPGPAE
jgi:hypothetical protein